MHPRRLILLFVGLIILLSFKVFLSSSSLSAGDAPYLTQGLMKTYISEPVSWTTVGTALGGNNQFLWIWPYMTFISVIGSGLSASSALLLRIFFYLPAVILSVTGGYFFASRYSKSFTTKLISSLIYSVNTYFLMMIDGGQVGIALAYGLFPWVLIALEAISNKLSTKSFLVALISLELITLADPRVTLVALLLALCLFGKKLKNIAGVAPLLIGINMYWIYPMVQSSSAGISGTVGQFTSFLNGLFLYAPHWSKNIFGEITYPSVLFLLFPLLILASLKNSETKKRFIASWLLFVFLVKGKTAPLGNIYELATSLPFGAAFRDSTKFMIPLILVSGVLIGQGIEVIQRRAKYVIYVFLIVFAGALYPALAGQLSFVLSGSETNPQVNAINTEIRTGQRAVWVNERDPRAETGSVQSINGFDLVNLRPFARLNVGDSDRLNFLNATESAAWFDVFGIDHVVLNGNPRKKTLTGKEQEDWNQTVELVNGQSFLKQTTTPSVYENTGTYQFMYAVEKMLFVIGSDSVYSKVNAEIPDSIPQKAGVAFLEDGRFDTTFEETYASTSAVIVNNGGGELSLAMSILKKHFNGFESASNSQFAQYTTDNYLKYKYELLIRELAFEDFDYTHGIAFSTQKNEELVFDFDLPEGDYVLALRALSKGNSPAIVKFQQVEKNIPLSDSLSWVTEELHVSKSNSVLTIKNNDALTVFNVVAVIPKADFLNAQAKARELISHFGMYTPETIPNDVFAVSTPVNARPSGTTRYIIEKPQSGNWLILNSQYSPQFQYSKDQLVYKSIPVYSSLNAFYLRPEWTTAVLSYSGQTTVRWGMYFSLISLLLIVIIMIYKLIDEK